MFGQNKTAPIAHHHDGQTLEVNEIFYTIQGEGPNAGEPAVFVRLAGCNLKCGFCDTSFEDSTILGIKEILDKIKALKSATSLVVLTGGEPMRQQILPLLALLDNAGYHAQIETAGTLWPTDIPEITLVAAIGMGAASLVCSPKTKKIHPLVEENCAHYKYIIRAGETSELDGLPNISTQIAGHRAEIFRPDAGTTIWVQPCAEYHAPDLINPDASLANMRACARVAMQYGYRVCLQLHKILNLP